MAAHNDQKMTPKLHSCAPDDAVVSVVPMVAVVFPDQKGRKRGGRLGGRDKRTVHLSAPHTFFFSSLRLHFPWPVRNVDWVMSVLTCCKKGRAASMVTVAPVNNPRIVELISPLSLPFSSFLGLCFLVVVGGVLCIYWKDPTPLQPAAQSCALL